MFGLLIPIGVVLPYAGPLANTENVETHDGSLAVKVEHIKANLAESGWMFCDGTSLPINSHWPLFGVIGRAYGGDATTFRLPDLRGRFIRGVTGTPGSAEPVLGPGDAPTYGTMKEMTSSEETQSPDGDPSVVKETRPVNLYLNYIIRAQ